MPFDCKTFRAKVVRWDLEEKEEKMWCRRSPILDNHIQRCLQKASRPRLIYGVFSIRIAKEGVRIWLHVYLMHAVFKSGMCTET